MSNARPRILCVDDEPHILNAIARSLRSSLDITIAESGRRALEIMCEADEPFQVVVSDMKMPEMTGAVFLAHARRQFPDTVRILLTGFAELENVVRAVNEGHIFRFLAKPCSTKDLLSAIQDGVRHHELLTSERVLLEQTLRGSIDALIEVLSLASPTLFGRAKRMRTLADMIAAHAGVEDRWLLEVAANLSQIGRITLPDGTATKLAMGEPLSEIEEAMVEQVPEMARAILGRIPRLDAILEIIDYIDKNFDGSGRPRNKTAGESIPFESRVLRLAGRVEELQGRGYSVRRILDTIRLESGHFDPRLVRSYEAISHIADDKTGTRGVAMYELRTGMCIVEPVRSRAGVMLVAGGQEVSESLLGRIQNYHDTVGIEEPIWVRPNATDGPLETPTDPGLVSCGDRPR